MKLKFLIAPIFIGLVSLPSYAENTYNFYFDEGNNEEKGSKAQSVTPSPQSEQKETIRSSFPLNIMSFSDTYFSVGGGVEDYDKTIRRRENVSWTSVGYWRTTRSDPLRQATLQVNAKLLPLIGFEVAAKVDDPLEGFRAAAYLETTIWKYLSLRVIGGGVTMEHPDLRGDYDTALYVGVGAQLRLFKSILLSASYNFMDRRINFERNNDTEIDEIASQFLTVNVSFDLLQMSNLF